MGERMVYDRKISNDVRYGHLRGRKLSNRLLGNQGMFMHLLFIAICIISTNRTFTNAQADNESTTKIPGKCDLFVNLHDRYDCHPDKSTNEERCLARGCCWDKDTSERMAKNPTNLDIPSCYFPADYDGYHVHKDGVKDIYEYRGATTFQLWTNTAVPSGFKGDVMTLMGQIRNYGDFINIQIRECHVHANKAKLPKLMLPPLIENNKIQRELFPLDYDVSDDGILTVRRSNTTGEQSFIFRSNLRLLVYSKNFIQLNSESPSDKFFGFGQHFSTTLNKEPNQNKKYTIFNYGSPPAPDNPSYSSHPFYINYEPPHDKTGPRAHGVYMHNTHPMDVIIQPKPGITWRILGGMIDLYIFSGPTPHDVVQQYGKLVGLPALPPMWALGFQLSRYNYDSDKGLKAAWARTVGRDIPLDGIWTDIDFMERRTSFTWNSPRVKDFFHQLKNNSLHHMPILDPGISAGEIPGSYKPYDLGKNMDIFIKPYKEPQVIETELVTMATKPPDAEEAPASTPMLHDTQEISITTPTTQEIPVTTEEVTETTTTESSVVEEIREPLIAVAWPESGETVFIDFTHAKIVDYLVELLKDYERLIDFDGLWLDMNEPETFTDGSKFGCPEGNELDEPQYIPANLHDNMNSRTLCMSAQLQAGSHFELHNIYALYQSIAFREALRIIKPNKRPFVVSRAQFSGQGKYSASWSGDINSSFSHLRWSIIAMIQSNWYAQPMTGGDICGFFSTASDDLCARWSSLGAFYPLARNHNNANNGDQDPGSRSEAVSKAASFALTKRYSLLPYLYTLFYQNHLIGAPVVRSLDFEFFKELDYTSTNRLSETINDQFLWGHALMIAPVVQENTTQRNVFLPPGRWFDVSVGIAISSREDDQKSVEFDSFRSHFEGHSADDNSRQLQLGIPIDVPHGQGSWVLNLETPLEAINLYLRGGHILATFSKPKTTISETIKQPFTLEVALSEHQEASGELYWDSGESPEEDQNYNHVEFKAENNQLTITMIKDSFQESVDFEGLIIYGLESERQITELDVNKISQEFRHYYQRQILICRFSNGKTIESVRLEKEKPIMIEWSSSKKF